MQQSNETPLDKKMPRMRAVNMVNSPANPSPVLSRLNRYHSRRMALAEEGKAALLAGHGCISEDSLTTDITIHDSHDYQSALKNLGDLFRAANQDYFDAFSATVVSVELSTYDADTHPLSDSDAFDDNFDCVQCVSDDEIEHCGYLGWLS